MRLLLDTHVLLWWQTDDPRLSPAARAAITADTHDVFVSAASAWEIAMKLRLGRMPGLEDAADRFLELIDADGFESLAMTHQHAQRAGGYAASHADPFDRMLAAQCEIEALVLVTQDARFAEFGTTTIW
jgi:PIN domain nuclease of toxin-antitoxin system